MALGMQLVALRTGREKISLAKGKQTRVWWLQLLVKQSKVFINCLPSHALRCSVPDWQRWRFPVLHKLSRVGNPALNKPLAQILGVIVLVLKVLRR